MFGIKIYIMELSFSKISSEQILIVSFYESYYIEQIISVNALVIHKNHTLKYFFQILATLKDLQTKAQKAIVNMIFIGQLFPRLSVRFQYISKKKKKKQKVKITSVVITKLFICSVCVSLHYGVCRRLVRNKISSQRIVSSRRLYTRTENSMWTKSKLTLFYLNIIKH